MSNIIFRKYEFRIPEIKFLIINKICYIKPKILKHLENTYRTAHIEFYRNTLCDLLLIGHKNGPCILIGSIKY